MRSDVETKFINKYTAFLKQLNLYLNHFPKHEKYALSQAIRNNAYSVFDLIIEGQKKYHKKTSLTNLDIQLEQLKAKILLAYHLGYFKYRDNKETDKDPEQLSIHRFEVLSTLTSEIGCMIGHAYKTDTIPYYRRLLDKYQIFNLLPPKLQGYLI